MVLENPTALTDQAISELCMVLAIGSQVTDDTEDSISYHWYTIARVWLHNNDRLRDIYTMRLMCLLSIHQIVENPDVSRHYLDMLLLIMPLYIYIFSPCSLFYILDIGKWVLTHSSDMAIEVGRYNGFLANAISSVISDDKERANWIRVWNTVKFLQRFAVHAIRYQDANDTMLQLVGYVSRVQSLGNA
jgi:hypothetical protein